MHMISMPAMSAPLSLPRTVLVGLLAVAALLVAAPSAATPAAKVSIYGAASGSTLELSVKRGRLVVKGLMAQTRPRGCRLKRHRMVAICRLHGVSRIEVTMGPSGDLVRVKERLPVPLTIYLGHGSDKFIGNGERDFCFPGGSRRNRCIGGGGNDVCITGPRNSDCVGGPGNDYCRHGTGSDGCWGGRGHDVCVMGPGQDGCHGGPGNDRLYGGPQPDQLYGGRGHDYCNGQRGWGKSHSCDAGPRR
jgi:Ca2+-binding RTX toxin-like protein